MIVNENDVVTLYPLGDALCSVNGVDVHEPVQLKQGKVTTRHLSKSGSYLEYYHSYKHDS